jgi:hypothetical protein
LYRYTKITDAGEQSAYLQKVKKHQLEAQRQCDAQEAKRHGKAGVGELPPTKAAKDGGGGGKGGQKKKQPSSSSQSQSQSSTSSSSSWVWKDHVRETHKAWSTSEGPCHAKHLAQRLWGGEEYCLHVDARAR